MRNCASEVWSFGPARNDEFQSRPVAMTVEPFRRRLSLQRHPCGRDHLRQLLVIGLHQCSEVGEPHRLARDVGDRELALLSGGNIT